MTNNQSGQILLLTVVALGVVLFTVLFIIGGSQVYFQNAQYSYQSESATAIAEAGVDKALASLNKTGGTYNGEQETLFGDGSYSVNITSTNATTKVIQSTGYIPNKANAKVKRTIKITSSRGVGVAFNYGIQVGEGGFILGNSNLVKGSIYSNGNITAGNSNKVTGDIWVAGGPQPLADQETDCLDTNCQDYLFGKIVNGQDRFDIAQSFKPGSSGVLNKVSVKIKKIGSPPDVTVRILQDLDGKPDKNAVLTSGTLYSSLVTSVYGWIDVAFNSSPAITADTAYWLMIDTSSDNNNYWSWQNDLAQGYSRGLPERSSDWTDKKAVWSLLDQSGPPGDLSFKSYLGGIPTSVRAGSNRLEVDGEVHANTIENLVIAKDAYYQTIISSTVNGTSYPSYADPPPKVFPISDANIEEWQSLVDKPETTITGDIIDCVSTLGPAKIIGNVNFNSGCKVTVKSPIWITGSLTLNSNNILTLDSSYGSTSGIIMVDGKVTLNSNNHFNGTGVDSSLLMVLSGFDSRTNNESAILVNSNGNTGVYYAGKGIIEPGTGNKFKELTAWGIRLISNSEIDYETGLSSQLFTSGPSGSFSLVKGTYQVK